MKRTGALITALTLSLTLAACSNTETEVESAPDATESIENSPKPEAPPVAKEEPADPKTMDEDKVLEGLAAGISSEATSEQWRSLAMTVCNQLKKSEKPLDKKGDTAYNAAKELWSHEWIKGEGDEVVQLESSQMDGIKMSLLVISSPHLACPEYIQDTADAVDRIQAERPE